MDVFLVNIDGSIREPPLKRPSMNITKGTNVMENFCLNAPYNDSVVFRYEVVGANEAQGNSSCFAEDKEQDHDAFTWTFEVPTSDEPGGNTSGSVRRKCCASTCTNNNLTSILHTFPGIHKKVNGFKSIDQTKLQRCRKWVMNSGTEKLLIIDPSRLQNRYFLCDEHFPASEFMSKLSTTLKRNAVPSLFNNCVPFSSYQMEVYDRNWNIANVGNTQNNGKESTNVHLAQTAKKQCHTSYVIPSFSKPCEKSQRGTIGQEVSDDKGQSENGRPTSGEKCFPHEACGVIIIETNVISREHSAMHTTLQSHVNLNKKRRVKRCAAHSCENTSTSSTMYRFPLLKTRTAESMPDMVNQTRFLLWIKKCGNKSLLRVDPKFVNNNFYLCKKHFGKESFMNKMTVRLKRDVVPSIFSCDEISDKNMSSYTSKIKLWQENPFDKNIFKDFSDSD